MAGSWVMAAACETARFPCGGRVGHECTGSAIARESDVRKDIGGSGGGGRDERADGAHVAARGVAVDGEGAADVADAGGPVRRCVAVGGRATTGGRYRRPAAGADAVQSAVPAASGSLSGGAATDATAAGPRLAGAVRPGPRGVLRAGGGSGSGSGVRLHRRLFRSSSRTARTKRRYAFGLPGVGKNHGLCAVGHALVEAGRSVLCVPAYALVQELLGAKRDLDLPRALRKLDLFEVILLD